MWGGREGGEVRWGVGWPGRRGVEVGCGVAGKEGR